MKLKLKVFGTRKTPQKKAAFKAVRLMRSPQARESSTSQPQLEVARDFSAQAYLLSQQRMREVEAQRARAHLSITHLTYKNI